SWAAGVRDSWRQQYLDTAVAWADAELRAGRVDVIVGPLRELTAEHPLDEPLAAMLMRALHATGRSAEALAHYAMVRQRIADELGADPSIELQAVHQAILRGELGTRRQGVAVPVSAPVVPAQLPAGVAGFAGRAGQLARLNELLADGTTRAPA